MSKRSSDREERRARDAKKRRSRWASEASEKTYIPGMPTILPGGMDTKQEQMYLLQLQIEDFTRRLRSGDLGIPPNPEDRSPSPEPIYNQEGKRLNTREYRTRRKLEEDRHKAVQRLLQENPDYKPPSDYKPPAIKITDKVYIPQDEHPEINFVGLLIGPRGNTLKTLEKETGAKVIIRGKGSVKEGKVGRKDGLPMPGEDEPLHAFITGSTQDSVTKCVERINKVIKQGIEIPESQNDLRKQQLRELALLNGTLRENEGLAKLKAIAEAQTIATNTIVCSSCGGAGHLASDCKAKRPGESLMAIEAPVLLGTAEDRAKMDSEYTALMAELGVADNMPGGGPGSLPGGNRGHKDNRPGQRSWQAPPPRVQQQQRLAGNGTTAPTTVAPCGPITPLIATTNSVMPALSPMSRSVPPPLMSQTCTYAGHVDTDWLTTHPPPPGTEPTQPPAVSPSSAPGSQHPPMSSRSGMPPMPPSMSQPIPPLPQGPPPPPQHMPSSHPPQPPQQSQSMQHSNSSSNQWRDPQSRPLSSQPATDASSPRSWPGLPPPRPPGPPPMMNTPPAPSNSGSPWMSGPPPPMTAGSNSSSGSSSGPHPQWMGAPPPMPAPPMPGPPPPPGTSSSSGGSSSWGMPHNMPPMPPPNSNSGWSGPPPPPPRGPPPPLPPPPAYPSNPPPPPPSSL